jgi:hypothetical protein
VRASYQRPDTLPASTPAPRTSSAPKRSRMTPHCQGATRNKNTRTAGLSSGFPSQYPTAAGTGTSALRIDTTTGAVQQEHIMVGIDTSPPTAAWPHRRRRESTRISQRLGDEGIEPGSDQQAHHQRLPDGQPVDPGELESCVQARGCPPGVEDGGTVPGPSRRERMYLPGIGQPLRPGQAHHGDAGDDRQAQRGGGQATAAVLPARDAVVAEDRDSHAQVLPSDPIGRSPSLRSSAAVPAPIADKRAHPPRTVGQASHTFPWCSTAGVAHA